MPTSSLDTAVDSLIAEVSNKVFDKPVSKKTTVLLLTAG
jgi:hypothetical protein